MVSCQRPIARWPIRQALINVTKNAIEAIGRDGTIEIRTRRSEGRCLLEIIDSGGGIPVEVEAHLFTPFYTTKENGQGIGLTIVQEVLLAHGTDFSLTSVEGGRTSFRVVL